MAFKGAIRTAIVLIETAIVMSSKMSKHEQMWLNFVGVVRNRQERAFIPPKNFV